MDDAAGGTGAQHREIARIAALTEALHHREALVTFSEINDLVRAASPTGELTATVRQLKVDSSPAVLEEEGHLIFPYFSLIFTSWRWRRLRDLDDEEQAEVILQRKAHLEAVTSEFAVVSGAPEDRELIAAIHRLLHAYFAINELDRVAERIALRLSRRSDDPTIEYTVHRFSTIRTMNQNVFGIETFIANFAPGGDLSMEGGGDLWLDTRASADLSILAHRAHDQKQSLSDSFRTDHEVQYVHAIPIRRGSRHRPSEILMMIGRERRIQSLAMKINENYVRLIIDKLMDGGRQAFEREIQARVRKAAALRSSDPMQFKLFCDWVTEQLYLLTHSHSVTIRQFSSYTNSLNLVACHPGTPEEQNALPGIPCDEHNSVNAFCYRQPSSKPVYLPVLEKIPEELREAGLESVFLTREHSKSEICLAIGDAPLRVGTLNLESPHYGAYEMDTQFLQSIAFHIQQFLSAMSTSGDAWWLSQLSLTHMATHELRDFKNTLDDHQRRALQNIIYTISPAEHLEMSGGATWEAFRKFVVKLHNRTTRGDPKNFDSIWAIDDLDSTEPIGQRYLSSLKLIAQSIVSNTRHSDYASNRIRVTKTRLGGRDVLTIDYDSVVSYLTPETVEEIDRRFSEPAMSGDGWHFGLFLIGVHSRLLGGDIEINPDCRKKLDYAPFGFKVRIPLPEAQT